MKRLDWLKMVVVAGLLLGCSGGDGGGSQDLNSELSTLDIAEDLATTDGSVDTSVEDLFGEVEAEVESDVEADVPSIVDPGPRLREAGWLRGDLHMHSTYSDGDDSVAIVVALAEYLGSETFIAANPEYEGNHLDFIAITDHRTVDQNSDPDFVSDSLILIPGDELGGPGHANAWGITEHISHDTEGDGCDADDYDAMSLEAHNQGGLISINHPYTSGNPFTWDVRDYDSVEIWNTLWGMMKDTYTTDTVDELLAGGYPERSPFFLKGTQYDGVTGNMQALRMYEAFLARGIHMAVVGGSDRHFLFANGFPTTWVLAEDSSVQGVLDGIDDNHTFVSRSPVSATIEFAVEANGTQAILGDKLTVGEPSTEVTVRVRVGRSQHGRLEIVGGHLVESDEALADAELGTVWFEADIDSEDFTVETTLIVSPGDWIYPRVLEPLIPADLPAELVAAAPQLAAGAAEGSEENYGPILDALWDFTRFDIALAPKKCDPAEWEDYRLLCLPVDDNGIATFYLPDWINRALNIHTENGEGTDWCMGAVGSAVLFE